MSRREASVAAARRIGLDDEGSRRTGSVAFPLAGFNRSGGVKTLVLLANALAERGWTVRMIAPDYAGVSPFSLAPGIRVVRLATGRRLPRSLRRLVYYGRLAVHAADAADLCVANFYPTLYCALLAKIRRPRVRIRYLVQGHEAVSHGTLADTHHASRLLRTMLARLSYRLPVSIIAVSTWLARTIRRLDAAVVSPGIDLEVFHPAAASPSAARRVVIGTIGSSATAKGYHVFCRAVEQLGADTGIEVRVAAHDPVPLPRGVVATRVSGMTERDMADFYRACDIFVFPSLAEGFGLPPLEAMACGCAVVTTDCGGVADFARHGTNCLAVAPGDATAMARAVTTLIADPALRGALAQHGARTAAAYRRDRMLERFVRALEP